VQVFVGLDPNGVARVEIYGLRWWHSAGVCVAHMLGMTPWGGAHANQGRSAAQQPLGSPDRDRYRGPSFSNLAFLESDAAIERPQSSSCEHKVLLRATGHDSS